MEKAIRKSIEGGWKPEKYREVWEFNPNNKTGVRKTFRASLTHWDMLSDPLFWQCLCKDMKWELRYGEFGGWSGVQEWEYLWHKFIHHVAEGKDANSFFEELLK